MMNQTAEAVANASHSNLAAELAQKKTANTASAPTYPPNCE